MAEVLYGVKVWVDPEGGASYIDWLKGGHVAEVASAPGVTWAKLTELEEKAPDGWVGFLALYGFKSRAALETYQNSGLFHSFAPVYKQFDGLFRVERIIGKVVETHDR
ncbi:DUF4286 family protein [Kordiimonas aestuarii]|uniref:DUF4286 family protein n=1 Tax=Kordiimonas aestuarii TaxID=1005925 RepID=UPI0021D19CBB|nr:DUF4286 family protein [Kordiimonas aestuarii]